MAKGLPIIRRRFIMNVRFPHDNTDGLVNFVFVENSGDICQLVNEDKTVDPVEAILEGIEKIEHKAGRGPDGAGDVAQRHDPAFSHGFPMVFDIQGHAIVFGGSPEGFFDIQISPVPHGIAAADNVFQLADQLVDGFPHFLDFPAGEGRECFFSQIL